MKYLFAVLFAVLFVCLNVSVHAAAVDPILGNSVTAITNAEEKAASGRVDPILGNKPVAVTSPPPVIQVIKPSKPRRHNQRNDCRYYSSTVVKTGGTVQVINNVDCPPTDRIFWAYRDPVNSSDSSYYFMPGIYEFAPLDNYIIDGQKIAFTTIWRGICHRKECSYAAGYVATDPNKGVVVALNPFFDVSPVLFYAPKASGPLTITKVDTYNNLLTLESQAGEYKMEGMAPPIIKTMGGDVFTINMFKNQWLQ